MFHGKINYFYGHFPYVNKLPEGKWQHPENQGELTSNVTDPVA